MDCSRRDFIKMTAIAAASAAAAGSLASCAPRKNPSIDQGSVTTYVSVCRFCGCGCGVLVEVQNGKVVSITGDPDNDSNRGLNCVKGYYLAKILKGSDRLTKPLIRLNPSTKGSNDASVYREAEWDEALDLVAEKLRTAWKNDKSRLAFWGSGQQPIVEGYATAKFWKAGLRSNNIDPNARLCMASAVVAFMSTFGTDEPAGCYADIDHADLFITWGANMAEAHPMLFSRIAARKQADGVRHYDLTTVRNRTSATADKVMVMEPNTDLAITNCICRYLLENETYDKQFVADHACFKHGREDIGNNDFENRDSYDKSDKGKTASDATAIDLAEFKRLVDPYTYEYTSALSGVSVEDLKALYEAFADPNCKIMSLWTMGANQHNRGTWVNQNFYNCHLLSGKIAKPGNGPFSLTGQPSACGTAREVGTFSHRLPADLVVANAQHRRYTEAVWNLPEGWLEDISEQGFHTTKIFREMSNGNMDFIWTAHNNWAQSMTDLNRFLGRDGQHTGIFNTFIVVSEVYPTISTAYADVVLPAAMWIEREGMFGNGERRTAVFEKAIDPPGDARWDLWMLMEVARRVLDGEKIGDADAFDALFGKWYDKDARDFKYDNQRDVCREIWNEYRTFSNPDPAENSYSSDRVLRIHDNLDKKEGWSPLKLTAKRLAPYDEYITQHGLTWPVQQVDGKWRATKWRFNGSGSQEDGFDAWNVQKWGDAGKKDGISFYKTQDHKPAITFHPYEPPAETRDDEYPFYMVTGRLLEHWHTGSMTRRVPELNNALPEALMDLCAEDMAEIGVKDGDRVKVTSRWGAFECTVSSAGRTQPGRHMCYVPFFAEETLVNMAQQEVYCPLSKEPDYKKTAVRIEKVEGGGK